ncbi:hypothetical protein DL93DRAFT_666313 [Clavulina sp. PMI_390]|nr:hypothetical protein DL93DRAFT_666313 [Clavulina sp. PMI_390]
MSPPTRRQQLSPLVQPTSVPAPQILSSSMPSARGSAPKPTPSMEPPPQPRAQVVVELPPYRPSAPAVPTSSGDNAPATETPKPLFLADQDDNEEPLANEEPPTVSNTRKTRPRRVSKKVVESTQEDTTTTNDSPTASGVRRSSRPSKRKVSAVQEHGEENTSTRPKRRRQTTSRIQTPDPLADATADAPGSEAEEDVGGEETHVSEVEDSDSDAEPRPVKVKKPRKQKARASSTTTANSLTSRRATSRTSATPAPRKPRKPRKTAEAIAEEDADAENKEHDPTITTMSALIEDLPVGRSTSTRLQIRERMKANLNRDRRRRDLLRTADRNVTMGKPRYEDNEEARQISPPPPPPTQEPNGEDIDRDRLFDEDAQDDGDEDWIGGIATSSFAPQINIDDDGNVAADELALDVERPDTFREENFERVFERDSDRFVNSLSHSKRHKGSARWTQAETAVFFHNLAMYGTDFESIARVMPGRTRAEVRNKFNAEDKRNEKLVTDYLMRRVPIDLEEAGRVTGKDLSGPPPEIPGIALPKMSEPPEGNPATTLEGAGATEGDVEDVDDADGEIDADLTLEGESGRISVTPTADNAVVSDDEDEALDME